ncbi:LLM class flavin-dependent oxidoreductase [Ornithinimicrobium cryptoxanthini]|uniref:LLM class flavin-dependent oxidoreductase n=1 Tax=Ornithinimicrobium cryptoxanthini TaxID=2934161 RepID=A0ABY4YLC2_9MICO|nr:LLM class flavin-dependent oxidoreductase [Ornithinimicrobium cryptoxanthini]USQ77310.1 LLM class flavin-dependent oxidoreductase [Ornithinimicrobium cryptoxanthini]
MPPNTRVPLSVLELVPRSQGQTPAEAMQASTVLATRLDELGYHRLWVAEHHGTEAFMSSATSVILGHFANHTQGIRLGSGGVMLPNHSPLMVAEYYGTLATLHGDRFDLGLGRAPGTDPLTAAALARSASGLNDFAGNVLDLVSYLGDGATTRVRALPGEGTNVPIWMLGSSTGGAQVAAALGLPFSFASHFAPQQMREALAVYRERFNADAETAQVERPTVMAGINVLVAPSEAEAHYLFTTAQQMVAAIRTGGSAPLAPPVDDLSTVVPEGLLSMIQEFHSVKAVGDPSQVVPQLKEFAAAYELDELIVTTYTHDPAMRQRSFELLADAWGVTPRV